LRGAGARICGAAWRREMSGAAPPPARDGGYKATRCPKSDSGCLRKSKSNTGSGASSQAGGPWAGASRGVLADQRDFRHIRCRRHSRRVCPRADSCCGSAAAAARQPDTVSNGRDSRHFGQHPGRAAVGQEETSPIRFRSAAVLNKPDIKSPPPQHQAKRRCSPRRAFRGRHHARSAAAGEATQYAHAHLLGDGGDALWRQLGGRAKAHGFRAITGLLDRLQDPPARNSEPTSSWSPASPRPGCGRNLTGFHCGAEITCR
jgi:hypothetical protein